MRTLSLALRNLLRNRRRSLATLLAMATGAASILLFGGYSASIKYTMQTAIVQTGGHLQIQHRDFYQFGSGNPTAYGIEGYPRILDAIRTDPALRDSVMVATPTLQFGGIVGNYAEGVSRTALAFGVIAKDQDRMRAWNGFGSSLHPPALAIDGAPPDAIVVGKSLAQVLRLCGPLHIPDCAVPEKEKPAEGAGLPDDVLALSEQEAADPATSTGTKGADGRIELLASSSRGTPNVASLRVVQVEQQGLKELDEVYLVLHLAQAQRLIYGATPPRATALLVQLKSGEQIPMVKQHLEALLARLGLQQPLVVKDFQSLNPFYVQSQQLFDTIFGFIYCLIAGIVLFTVGNTMNMAVVERTIEIGTLRAIGVRRAGIRRLFVMEGFLLGLAGAATGLAGAFILATVINHAGLTWLPPGSAQPIPLALRIWGEDALLAGTTLGLVIVATVSALWPAHRAAKMVVVDALRHT